MADNYTFKDASGNTITHASKDVGSGVQATRHVEVDEANVAIAKAEDAAHSSGDKGYMLLAVRKDTATALAGADGDYIPLIVDSAGRLHVTPAAGVAAHDAANSGNPVKIGGVVRETFGGSDINGNDVGDLRMDRYQRIYVVPTGDAAGSNSTSPPLVYARPETLTLLLKPASPTPSGTDITDDAGNDIVAGDLTIVDTNPHYFVIPMAASRYRSAVIMINNGSPSWDQQATVTLSSGFKDGSVYYPFATLLRFTLAVNAGLRYVIGTNSTGVGGLVGESPSSAVGYGYYSVPAISDGHPYLMLNIQFSVAPTAGTLQRLAIARLGF